MTTKAETSSHINQLRLALQPALLKSKLHKTKGVKNKLTQPCLFITGYHLNKRLFIVRFISARTSSLPFPLRWQQSVSLKCLILSLGGTKCCFNSLKISLLVFSTSSAATSRLFQTPITKTSVFPYRETHRAKLTRLAMISSGVFAGFCWKGVRSLLPTAKTT